MKIVLASHSVQGDYFRVGSHHLARELSLLGHRVAHLSTPLSLPQIARRPSVLREPRGRLAVLGHRVDGHGTVHCVPLTVLPARLVQTRRAALQQLRRSGFGDADVVVVDQPLLHPLLSGLPSATVVYRPTDVHVGGALRRAETVVLHRAHGVVATSQHVLDSLDALAWSVPTLVLENGVQVSAFDTGRDGGRAGLVYVGALDHRFDWDVVGAIARALPDEPVTVIGPRPRTVPDLPPTVRLLGPVAHDLVPHHLQAARVGLLPFTLDPVNAGRSPMKYYEYRAAGLNIVGRWTPALASRPGPGVFLYQDPDRAVDAVRAALRAAFVGDARAEAAEMDWSARARTLMAFLSDLTAVRPSAAG